MAFLGGGCAALAGALAAVSFYRFTEFHNNIDAIYLILAAMFMQRLAERILPGRGN
jgi:hypothetical protein